MQNAPTNLKAKGRKSCKGIRWDNRALLFNKPSRIAQYQTMFWERKNGRWYGQWKWVTNEKPDHAQAAKARDHAIAAWKATDIPAEIFLRIVDCFVGGPVPDQDTYSAAAKGNSWEHWQAWEARDVNGLGNLALVCRAWYDRAAALLYSKPSVYRHNVDKLCAILRHSPDRLGLHAKHIRIWGQNPWEVSSRLSKLLPNLLSLTWVGSSFIPRIELSWPPLASSVHRVIAISHSAFKSLVRLKVQNCTFESSNEFFQLICALPSLCELHIESTNLELISAVHPRKRVSRIQRMGCIGGNSRSIAPLLAHVFSWPYLDHSTSSESSSARGFHGLSDREASIVVRILQMVQTTGRSHDKSYLQLDRTSDENIWVAWSESSVQWPQIEFYAVQHSFFEHSTDTHPQSQLASIRWVVIHIHRTDGAPYFYAVGPTALREIDKMLSQLPSLHSVIFEILDSTASTDELAALFTQVGRARVRQRTCQEVHKRVADAHARHCALNGSAPPKLPTWTRRECTRIRTELHHAIYAEALY